MKAAFYERTGPAADVLQLGELPDPQPQRGEVRVRLRWSGVNPSDVKSRAGLRSRVMPFPRITPHSDGMGLIDALGDGVDTARIGQRVWTWNAAWGRPAGTAAQYVVLPAAQAVPMPDSVPDVAGACFGIPALTALHAVLVAGGVTGKSVLVAGGAGAVGHYAIQFARLAGAAQVIATVSTETKAEVARAAGADAVIRYRDENVAERVMALTGGRGVERLIEVDIAANAAAHHGALANGADWVVYGSGAPNFTLPFFPMISRNVSLRCFIVYHLDAADRRRAEDTLRAFLDRGALQHLIAARLPLERIAEAHQLVERGAVVGNVVVEIP